MLKSVTYLLAVVLAVGVLAVGPGCSAAGPAKAVPADQMLFNYVNAPDSSYKWEKGPGWDLASLAGGSVSDILLTSQTWRGITWKHLLRIVKPAQVKHPGWMALYISGGSGEPKMGQPSGDDQLAMALAQSAGAPVAVLTLVPNQPLFGGLVEDQIISYTFQEFLKDGDPTWPLLFPMVKSAVRAMDTIQQYAKQEWNEDIGSFLVFGGSKRGWTTWLTGAYDGGKRVKAIAPAVIDVLNMRKQIPHQLEMWGAYSEEINDYSSKGLTESFNSPRGQVLWTAVDPYTYRKRLTMPKLIILGANDPYWTTDALNLYWDDLVGPKYTLRVPNAGHSLAQGIQRVINTLSAFYRTEAAGESMPQISWARDIQDGKLILTIKAAKATGARAWEALADNLDFRPEKWESADMQSDKKGVFSITVQRPADKNEAVFGEADFTSDGKPYTLSTQPAILKK